MVTFYVCDNVNHPLIQHSVSDARINTMSVYRDGVISKHNKTLKETVFKSSFMISVKKLESYNKNEERFLEFLKEIADENPLKCKIIVEIVYKNAGGKTVTDTFEFRKHSKKLLTLLCLEDEWTIFAESCCSKGVLK